MSKANAKPKPTKAQASQAPKPSAAATATTSADSAGALVPAAKASSKPRPPDKFHGRGGMYTVVNGRRVLVDETPAKGEAQIATSGENNG